MLDPLGAADAMSTSPQTPFDTLFAQLTQGMSPPAPARRVVNVVGYDVDAQHTSAERVVWIPRGFRTEFQPFEIPGATTPYRQAWQWDVSIYGVSLDRLGAMHSLLVAWLDIMAGPALGSPPSDDAAPALLRGTVDLAALVYPYSGLAGLSIAVTVPGARSLEFPSTPLATPQAISDAVNAAALAATGPVQFIRARIIRDGAEQYLELLLPTDPTGTAGATLTIDPDAANSACAILGFSAGDDNITATGTPPTRPYRPGYFVADTITPGVRGGDASAQGWGAIVQVTLYRPIVSLQSLVGVIADTPLQVIATGGDTPDENVVDIA